MPSEVELGSPTAPSEELADWRGGRRSRVRHLLEEADPAMAGAVKWRPASIPTGVPEWSHDGSRRTGEPSADAVTLATAEGASLDERAFNPRIRPPAASYPSPGRS